MNSEHERIATVTEKTETKGGKGLLGETDMPDLRANPLHLTEERYKKGHLERREQETSGKPKKNGENALIPITIQRRKELCFWADTRVSWVFKDTKDQGCVELVEHPSGNEHPGCLSESPSEEVGVE